MSESTFAHLEETARATAIIPIDGLKDMTPELVCRPATKANKPYFNALLASERRGRAARGSRMTVDELNKFLKRQRLLVSQHCVKRWNEGTVIDADGNSVKFSKAECLNFLTALPDRIFDVFLSELTDDINFIVQDEGGDEDEDPSDPETDLETQAGN